MPGMSDTNVERASKLDTTALSDALDRLGIAGQCLNIKPLDPRFRLTGRAFTILYGPAGTPPGTVGDYIDDVPPGSVVVLDNGGARERDGVGRHPDRGRARARHRGHRDRRRVPRHAPGARARLSESSAGVTRCARAKIACRWRPRTAPSTSATRASNPGDILRGDADGVVVIPRAHEDAVLTAAEEIDARRAAHPERDQRRPHADRSPKRLGYHQLQTRQK